MRSAWEEIKFLKNTIDEGALNVVPSDTLTQVNVLIGKTTQSWTVKAIELKKEVAWLKSAVSN